MEKVCRLSLLLDSLSKMGSMSNIAVLWQRKLMVSWLAVGKVLTVAKEGEPAPLLCSKMINGLDCLIWAKFEIAGLFRLEKGRFRGNIVSVCKCLKRGCKEDSLFPAVCSDRTGGNAWNTGNSIWMSESTFSLEGWWALAQVAKSCCEVYYLRDIQKASGLCPG